jgi:hypothetical protein
MVTTATLPDDEGDWVQRLSRTAPGKHLQEHFSCINYIIANKSRLGSSCEEAETFRRVFCSAYAKNEMCFGLPRPTPKFIAIVNLSGFRGVLYSNRPTLITMLCKAHAMADPSTMTHVNRVLDYVTRKECPLLCCLSLPWQAGVVNLHWSLRSLERSEKGVLRDGGMYYASNADSVRVAGSTIDREVGDPVVLQRQIAAMTSNMSATNLDLIIEDSDDTTESGEASDERVQKLAAVTAVVKADRTRLLGELQRLRDDHEEKLQVAYKIADERANLAAANASKITESLNQRLEEAEAAMRAAEAQSNHLESELKEARRKVSEMDLLHGSELAKVQADLKVHEIGAKSATKELAALQRSSARETEAMDKAHSSEVQAMERRFSDTTLSLRSAQLDRDRLKDEQARLDAVCEQLRCEKQTLVYDALRSRKTTLAYRVTMLLARHKHEMLRQQLQKQSKKKSPEFLQMMADAEGAATEAEVRAEQAERRACKAEQQLATKVKECETCLDEALDNRVEREGTCQKLQSAMDATLAANAELERKVADLEAKGVETQSAPGSQDAQTETVPVTTKAELELGELQMQHARLLDEKEKLQAALEQTVHSSDSSPVAGGVQTDQGDRFSQTPSPVAAPCASDAAASMASPTGGEMHNTVRQEVYSQVYHQVVVPQGGGWAGQSPPLFEMGSDTNGDPAVEALIGQLQTGMRSLVDMVRHGQQSKHTADMLWGELQATKRFMGPDPMGAWQQQQQGGYYVDANMGSMMGMQPMPMVPMAAPMQSAPFPAGQGWQPHKQHPAQPASRMPASKRGHGRR